MFIYYIIMIKKTSKWEIIKEYNKPVTSKDGKHKKVVLAKVWDKTKLIRFGAVGYSDYTKHKDKERRKNYLARSWWIRDKEWNLTKNNKLSKNYRARKVLW